MYLLSCSYLLLLLHAVHGYGPRKLYTLKMPEKIISAKVIGRQLFLVGNNFIGKVENVNSKIKSKSKMDYRLLNKDIAFPRNIGKVPAKALPNTNDNNMLFWVTSRTENLTNGEINILKETSAYSVWRNIDLDSGWNYERVQWIDMDQDGTLDCLTARIRGSVGQMVWFEQPQGNSLWFQHVLHEGMADGNFISFIRGGKRYILVAGNQYNTIGLFWTLDRKNRFISQKQMRHRVIDNYGRYNDVQMVDLNKDGKADILTSVIRIGDSRGHVLGYNMPQDIQYGPWTKRVLASGFTADYSPGKAIAYWPDKNKRRTERPSIFLSGGYEKSLFILSPCPKNKGWSYKKSKIPLFASGLVGIPFIIDLDGDNFMEFIVPQENSVHVYAYNKLSAGQNMCTNNGGGSMQSVAPGSLFKPRPKPATSGIAGPPKRPSGAGSNPNKPQTNSISGPVFPKSPMDSNGEDPQPSNAETEAPYFKNDLYVPKNPRTPSNNQVSTDNKPAKSSHSRVNNQRPNAFQSNGGNSVNNAITGDSSSNSFQTNNNANSKPQWPDYARNRSSIYSEMNSILRQKVKTLSNGLKGHSGSDSDVIIVSTDLASEGFTSGSLLHATKDKFSSWDDAKYACEFEKRSLCTLPQLISVAEHQDVEENTWGLYDMKGSAAAIENCYEGQVKFAGYNCFAGKVAFAKVMRETSLPALCCSTLNKAKMTTKKYTMHKQAQSACNEMSHHLCSFTEMIDVWIESTYKNMSLNWFNNPDVLIRMVQNCSVADRDPRSSFQCVGGIFETFELSNSYAYANAFCCPNSSTSRTLSNLTFSALLIIALSMLL